MKTTLGEIRAKKPCNDGYKILCDGLCTTDPDMVVTLSQILKINGVRDAYWSLRCWDYRDIAPLLADVAESVLPIFETARPGDDGVRVCIETIREYARGGCSIDELRDASESAYASAAYSAFYSASSADACAAYAAAYASAYADYAAYAASYAAAEAAYANAGDDQWEINEQLMREFIAQKEGQQ